MVVVTGMTYTEAVLRARDVDQLGPAERDRVLDHLHARYPEAVAAVLDDLGMPKARELDRPETERLAS
jgi:hypothetical protein